MNAASKTLGYFYSDNHFFLATTSNVTNLDANNINIKKEFPQFTGIIFNSDESTGCYKMS